jgi:glycosyltransferase involved in cell wall biosynthesis
MTTRQPDTVYVDARALQDPDYRFRGVGQHSASLLRALRQYDWSGRRPRTVALIDPSMEPIAPVHGLLFDEITNLSRAERDAGVAWFISLSPMTHDPVKVSGFLQDPALYKICLFYDLIPLEFPERYLAVPALRADYLVTLAWLRCFDVFASISQFSGEAVIQRMAIDPAKVFVSNVAVRQELQPRPNDRPVPFSARNQIIVSGGGDPRKNPECALVAHAKSLVLRKLGVTIAVFGSYPESMRDAFRTQYRQAGGEAQNLVFYSHLSDEDLRQAYRNSIVTIVPSRAEGFSIPIVESNAAETPVLASDVGAHPELAHDAAWRFGPDEIDRLQEQMERLASDEAIWTKLRDAQAGVWKRYTLEAVGQRFMDGVLAHAPQVSAPAPAVLRGARPVLGILSPLPPAHSGVADYTVTTLRPLKAVADLHMFTATPNAKWEDGWASLQPVSVARTSSIQFDATVSVIGNSFHHSEILDYLLERGGACIAHDARQIDFYFHERGIPKALEVASREMKRPVEQPELTHWLLNQRELPILFLSELAQAAQPLLVHSATTATEIERLYGKAPGLLPFAQYRPPVYERLSKSQRDKTRDDLKIEPGRIIIATFGIVSPDKAPMELIWALHMLRSWGVNAELVLCGLANPDMLRDLTPIIDRLCLGEFVRIFDTPIDDKTYDDYLVAADIGVQLRTYFMGGLSGALNDCIAAALPTISNAHLAEAMQSPGFIKRIPDGLSSLLIGEAVLEILGDRNFGIRPLEEAKAFADAHSPARYCQALMNHLGIDISVAPSTQPARRR